MKSLTRKEREHALELLDMSEMAQRQAELICEQVIRVFTQDLDDRVQGIILTGSVARHEGTFLRDGNGWRLIGDAEFLLVFRAGARFPSNDVLVRLRQQVEANLAQQGLQASLSFAVIHPEYLIGLEPHIFAYELRSCGKVIWGNRDLLELIPNFPESQLVLEDAWRLLCNRMIELMAAAASSPANSLSYRVVKLYLDMATSLLVFLGSYKPTYLGRVHALHQLAESAKTPEAPFDLRAFHERIAFFTNWKLQCVEVAGALNTFAPDTFVSWKALVEDVHALWRWELCRLAAGPASATDQELLSQWMRRQSVALRLRGWMYVARSQKWGRSWRSWPSWMCRGWKASPRYWIYAAASELFFQLPVFFGHGLDAVGGPSEATFQAWLPGIPASCRALREPWRRQALAISWNYHQFLEGTRS